MSARVVVAGGRRCALSFNRDISDRFATMAETDVARRRIALAAKVGGVGLWDWDCTTGAVFINDQLAAQIGYDLDEVEWSHAAWAERVPPDDLPPTLEQLHAYLDGRVDRYAA